MHRNIMLRTAVISAIRHKMTALGFNEMATPILSATSPEGARDFVVPSRLNPGKFYALPQAPQQFKQLLMISGFDRYFQIAPCFRDEDARADRSPGEFYQLDVEMSFVEQEDVFQPIEKLMTELFEEFGGGRHVTSPFPRIPFRESMLKYGSDKPDLRAKLELVDITDIFEGSEFKAFAGKHVRALPVPDVAGQPRKFFDQLGDYAVEQGAKGLAWVRVGEDGSLTGPIAKFLTEDERRRADQARCRLAPGHAVFFGAGEFDEVSKIMGAVRVEAAKRAGHFEENVFRFCWIVDFPMYEKDEETGKIDFSHNPFSMPQGGLEALETQDPLDILGWQYDIVCNGVELSSGAIRNHEPEIMLKAFEIAGYDRETVEEQVRRHAARVPLRRPAARRHRPGRRPHRHAARRRAEHPRDDRLPAQRQRPGPDDGRADGAGGDPAARAAPLGAQAAAEVVRRSSAHSALPPFRFHVRSVFRAHSGS